LTCVLPEKMKRPDRPLSKHEKVAVPV